MRAKILSKKPSLHEEDKFFLIIDDIVEMAICKYKIMFRRHKNGTLYRSNCNYEQSFNIQLEAEKGEIIDLTELYVEELDNITNRWELI